MSTLIFTANLRRCDIRYSLYSTLSLSLSRAGTHENMDRWKSLVFVLNEMTTRVR